MVSGDGGGHGRHVPGPSPLEAVHIRAIEAGFTGEEGAAGAVDDIGHRADNAQMQRRVTLGGGEGGDAAHPLGAIVIAVGEEVIDDKEAQTGAGRARGDKDGDGEKGGEDQADFDDAAPVSAPAGADVAEGLTGGDDAEQEDAGNDQGGAVQNGGTGDVEVDVPVAPVAGRGHREQGSDEAGRQGAAIEQKG